MKLKKFKKDAMSGPVNLPDYGEVLARGYGEEPPQDVVARMIAEHGYNA